MARTAVAEGQKDTGKKTGGRDSTPAIDPKAPPTKVDQAAAQPLSAILIALTQLVEASPAATAVATTGDGEPAPASTDGAGAGQNAAAPPAQLPTASPPADAAGVAASATQTVALTANGPAIDPVATVLPKTDRNPLIDQLGQDAKLAVPADATGAKPAAGGAGQAPSAAGAEQTPAQAGPAKVSPALAIASAAAAAAGKAKASDTQAAQPAGRPAPTAAVAEASTVSAGGQATEVRATPATAPAAATQARSTVDLQHAVDAVRTTIAIAAKQGASTARINLSPPELGSIRIQLTRTPEGLIARVFAEHPEAAQTMQQHGDELRRSLEQSGTHVLRLEIETSGRRDQQPGHSGGAGSGSKSTDQPAGGEHDASVPGASAITLELPDGSLVNVLA